MVDDERSESAEDDLRTPVDRFPDPVVRYVVREDDAVLQGANPAFEQLFDGEPTGTTVREWWTDFDDVVGDDAVEEFLAAITAGEQFTARLVVTTRTGDAQQGEKRVFRLRSIPSGDTDTGVDTDVGSGYLVLTDVTESATEVAEMDRIASVISHDLRNPLDVAKARLEAARETGDEEQFEHVVTAHERIEEIIQNVLTMTRGEDALDRRSFVALEPVATDAWSTVDTAVGTLTVADDLPVVEADPNRLRRLFENLFRNSIEHGQPIEQSDPADGDPIQIHVGATEDGFFVADDGTGIPVDEREAVFAAGYTSEDAGTGLGLSIVTRIAEAHGWTVTVTESADGGARFEFGGLGGERTDTVGHN
jgi:signal transduction histidine kinase